MRKVNIFSVLINQLCNLSDNSTYNNHNQLTHTTMLELTYINKLGETLNMKLNKDTKQITFNHTDIHDEGVYEDFTFVGKYLLNDDELKVFGAFLKLSSALL